MLIEQDLEEEDEPRQIYAELDSGRRGVRRVEFYSNGLCFAYGGAYGREEALSPTPYPAALRTLHRPGEVEAPALTAAALQQIWGHAPGRPDRFLGMFA